MELNCDNKYRNHEYRIAGLMSGFGTGVVVVEGGVDVGQLTATHSRATPRLPSFTQSDHPPQINPSFCSSAYFSKIKGN